MDTGQLAQIIVMAGFVLTALVFLAFFVGLGWMAIRAMRTRAGDRDAPDLAQTQALYRALDETFSLEELRELAFEMGIDLESLPGEGRSAQARELISYCRRHGRLGELRTRVVAKRPHLAPSLQ